MPSLVLGSARAQFTITLSAAVAEPVSVEWFTSDGTALAGRDYEANGGTVVFAPGEASKTVEVFVRGRTIETEDRVFYVRMLPPVNAILADEVGACVIHVDTTGSQPVMAVVIPKGEKGERGYSAYEIALQNGFVGTEAEWLASLRPSPEELAPLVAPLINANDMEVTAQGTEALAHPDKSAVKGFAGRIAYMALAKKAIAPALTAGVNVIPLGAFVGDAVKPDNFTGFKVIVLRAGAVVQVNWRHLRESNEIRVENGVAGDIPIAVQYDIGSGKLDDGDITAGGETMQLSSWLLHLLALIGGNAQTLSDLFDADDPLHGVAMLGRAPLIIQSVDELRATPGREAGDRAYLLNYEAGDGKGRRYLTWVPGAEADDDGMYFAAPGGTWQSDLTDEGHVSAEFYGMPFADGVNCYNRFDSMYQYCKRLKISMRCGSGPKGIGRYNFGSASCPISGPRDPGHALVSMGFNLYSDPSVTFETISNGGADVFNLCSIADFGIYGWPRINGTLLTQDGSGSNGVSMVFGARNLVIQVQPMDMPRVWKVDGGTDGGHGVTIQYGTGNENEYENVEIDTRSIRCVSGFNIDFSPTSTITHQNRAIKLNLYADTCYRGLTIGGLPPNAPVIDPATAQPIAAVTGRAFTLNCQQHVLDLRSWFTDIDVQVLNTLEAAAIRQHPYDSLVEVVRVLSSQQARIRVSGRVLSVDTLYDIGGALMAGNEYPAINESNIELNVTCTSATNRLVVGDPGASAGIRNSIFRVWGAEAEYTKLMGHVTGSSIFVDGSQLTPTNYPGDASQQAAGGPISRVIYRQPITGIKSVNAPSKAKMGDIVEVVRMGTSTGGTLSVFGLMNMLAGTSVRLGYNGTIWEVLP